MGPGGLLGGRELALCPVARVEGVADRLSDGRYRAGFRLAGGAHSLRDLNNNVRVGPGVGQARDLNTLAGARRADQDPAGLDPQGVAGADGEAGPENGPAGSADIGPGGLGGDDVSGERFTCCPT